MSLPKRTKLALSMYMEGSKIKKLMTCLYLSCTKYQIIHKSGYEDTGVCFIISHEKVIRNDHLAIFQRLFDFSQIANNSKYCKIEFKRRFGFSWKRLLVSRFNINTLIELQMKEALQSINLTKTKKVIVFCDTTPLQNYIVEHCHQHNIDTLSLQHGFYPLAVNNYWRKVYLASNARTFAAWDWQTVEFMNKFSRSRKRNFIEAGPILLEQNSGIGANESSYFEIAVYSAGVDQAEINAYLVDLIKYIKGNEENIKITFVCHPYFGFFDRLVSSLRTGVQFESNKKKNGPYDCHLVLNSSVWLELEQKNFNYIRLDSFFVNQTPFAEILDKIQRRDFKSEQDVTDNLRLPFCNSDEALSRVSNYIGFRKD